MRSPGANNNKVDLNFSWVVGDKLAGCRIPLDEDEVGYLRQQGVDVLIRVVEQHLTGIPRSLLEQFGIEEYNEPVTDFSAPSQEQLVGILSFLGRCVAEQKRVAVACRAGRGRTGTVLACAFVMNGLTSDEAIVEIRRLRPTSVEPGEQEEAIVTFASTLKLSGGLAQDLHRDWPGHLLGASSPQRDARSSLPKL